MSVTEVVIWILYVVPPLRLSSGVTVNVLSLLEAEGAADIFMQVVKLSEESRKLPEQVVLSVLVVIVLVDIVSLNVTATVVETATHFELQRDGAKEYDVPRTVKQRQLNRDEGRDLIEKGEVGPLEEFISAKGKPFKATLYLDARKQVKFRFEKRRRKKKGSK